MWFKFDLFVYFSLPSDLIGLDEKTNDIADVLKQRGTQQENDDIIKMHSHYS